MHQIYDYVIIGSGFGGSVSAMRLTEKGYSVLLLEKGKRYHDNDFAKSNWQYWKYLWIPAIRAHGILQISILKGVMVLHGAGVGGGSLGYANVLEVPTDETFATSAWNQNVAWGKVLKPHYETAKKMLGVARNPKLWKADDMLKQFAGERGMSQTFRATDVGAYFGEEGVTVPDPYFNGEGPAGGMPSLRRVHGRMPVQCKEHAAQKLFVFRGEEWREDYFRSRSGGHQTPHPNPSPCPLRGCFARRGTKGDGRL